MSCCQWKPGYYSLINLWWMRWEYQENPFGSPRRRLKLFLAMSDIYFNFLFPPLLPQNYLLCLILTKSALIWSIGLVWRRVRYIWGRMTLNKNSIMVQFRGGDTAGPKTQKMFFFEPINRESKVSISIVYLYWLTTFIVSANHTVIGRYLSILKN